MAILAIVRDLIVRDPDKLLRHAHVGALLGCDDSERCPIAQ
jgi:hypothetical protein